MDRSVDFADSYITARCPREDVALQTVDRDMAAGGAQLYVVLVGNADAELGLSLPIPEPPTGSVPATTNRHHAVGLLELQLEALGSLDNHFDSVAIPALDVDGTEIRIDHQPRAGSGVEGATNGVVGVGGARRDGDGRTDRQTRCKSAS